MTSVMYPVIGRSTTFSAKLKALSFLLHGDDHARLDILCSARHCADHDVGLDEPPLFGAENHADPDHVPADLPSLSQIEEMLIARVHTFVEVRQHRGQQYKYTGTLPLRW
jgi:uncharacterized protein DUF6570